MGRMINTIWTSIFRELSEQVFGALKTDRLSQHQRTNAYKFRSTSMKVHRNKHALLLCHSCISHPLALNIPKNFCHQGLHSVIHHFPGNYNGSWNTTLDKFFNWMSNFVRKLWPTISYNKSFCMEVTEIWTKQFEGDLIFGSSKKPRHEADAAYLCPPVDVVNILCWCTAQWNGWHAALQRSKDVLWCYD